MDINEWNLLTKAKQRHWYQASTEHCWYQSILWIGFIRLIVVALLFHTHMLANHSLIILFPEQVAEDANHDPDQ